MLPIIIDAVALIALLKVVSDEEVGFGAACLLSIVALALIAGIGFAGILAAAVIAAALFGLAVSAMYGVEIKRSLLIGGVFVVVHIATAVGLQMMLRP
jgi:hypothetical protein